MSQDQNNQNPWQSPPPPGTQQTPPNYQQPNYQQPPPGGYQQGYQQVPPGGYQQGFGMGGQIPHPKASAIGTCGTLGLVFTFLLGIVGLVLNIVTLSMASAPMNEIRSNPGRYTDDSVRKIKNGRTCAIIGLSIQGFAILLLIIFVAANS